MTVSSSSILIVGCGNVGSRHLQAIAKLTNLTSIDIVEPSKDAQIIAKSRLSEIPFDKTKIEVNWHSSLQRVRNECDLTIVATASVGRVELIRNLLELGYSRFLVEKVVCQSTEDYIRLLDDIKAFNAKGWVNTNRRYFEAYQRIKREVEDSKKIYFSVTAGNEGLGCNAIHHLDLFSWFSGSLQIRLNGDFLYNRIFPNKRGRNFKEFAGTIIGSNDKESVMTISFLPINNLPRTVTIVGDDLYIVVDETNEKAHTISGKDELGDLKFRFEHVSGITTKIATEILEKDNCMLPTLEESFYGHSELFRIFNDHITQLTGKKMVLCPIT
ncbi:MAG: Gfo/Idh/MocA family oxidoreductase [Candidatus Hodarchaeota archaeon]